MCTWLPMSTPHPMHSLVETWVPLCGIVCLSQSPYFCSPTLVRMCTCISTWIYVHLTTHVCSPLCIVLWKPGCPCMAVCLWPSHLIFVPTPCLECVHASGHEFMSTWLPMSAPTLWIVSWKCGCPCTAVCLCPSHLISVPTPCLEYVHASVHVFMSVWLPMLAQPPMDSYMETWVPLCDRECVSQSPYFWSDTLVRMCTCIGTWIYVHLTTHVFSTPMHSLMKTWVPLYGSVFVSQSPHFCSHTLSRIFPCISTWIYVHLTAHICSTPYA